MALTFARLLGGTAGFLAVCVSTGINRGDIAIFTFAKDSSNIRSITINETGSGAVVNLVMSGTQDADSSMETVSLRVHIEYRKDQPNDIEMIKHHALRQAMKAIQHEITLCQARANAKAVRW